jgi:hypothetical protein
MAYANARLIHALRVTVARLREGAAYSWGHLGMCNCGHLAQTITRRSRREIHEAALARGGEWRDRAREYCPSSGFPIDEIIRELLDCGLSTSDLADLEYLSDERVRRRIPGRPHLRRNVRDDLLLYLETWAKLLEEELEQRTASAGAAA